MIGFRAVTALVVAVSAGVACWVGVLQFRRAEASVLPLAPVRAGEFLEVIRTRGQIQAFRAIPIYAPLAPDLRIAWMAPPSEPLEQGDPMVRFDSSSSERQLIERRAAAERARAALDQAIADARVSAEQDRRDLIDARLGVELAELATRDSEFVAQLEAERARIDHRIAEQNLRQLEAEVAQREVSRQSQLASLRRQLEGADVWVRLIESQIARMEILAPIAGYALYIQNTSTIAAALSGGAVQPLRVGDQVAGGMNIATIPDMSSLLLEVTVEEFDRGRLRIGDAVIVRVDALPEVAIETALTGISPLAELSLETRGRSFYAQAVLGADADPRIRPGMNGTLDIIISRLPDATIVPARALFTRGGKPAVYVAAAEGFQPIEVEVLARNADEIAVTGVARDARVALADPFAAGGERGSEGEGRAR